MSMLHETEDWSERLNRGNCPKCELMPKPENQVITSCKHMYCGGCYYSLSIAGEPLQRICSKCNSGIEAAARCYLPEEETIGKSPPNLTEATLTDPSKKQSPKKKRKKNVKKKQGAGFYEVVAPSRVEDEDEPDDDEEVD
ncbi:hypothetical protein BBP40_009843 [Aspergillus hancockii]|nr:hypothetical protein BBP40_009843 [Aspergillus hancockii]